MAKHVMARRTAATESYKQIAEMASQNGFNRVIEHLNSQSNQRDSSYLWELDREKGEWHLSEASTRQLISEPCSELLHYTDSSTRAIINGGQLTGSQSLIQDGRGSAVEKHYKVAEQRLIKSQGKANEALLAIDGYTTSSQGSLLNRSRVSRRFELKEIVGTENDYAVMAAKHLELRNSLISGSGSILWLDNQKQDHNSRFRSSSDCSASGLARETSSRRIETGFRVWPIRNKSIPIGLFNGQFIAQDNHPNGSGTRVWDIHSDPNQTQCKQSVCIAWKSGNQFGAWEEGEPYATVERINQQNPMSEAKRISIHSEKLCNNNQQKACQLQINSITLKNKAVLAIETKNRNGPRPVVLGISEQAEIDLQEGQLCQAGYSRESSGQQNCDKKADPSNLIMITAGKKELTNCSSLQRPIVKIAGSALPAAVIAMPGGAVHATGTTKINGMIWADSICANQGIALDTSSTNNSNKSLIADFRAKWDPDDTQAFGRIINRAIRGTGLDSFQQW